MQTQENTSEDTSPKIEPRKIAVMATDDNPMYSFLVPFTGYYWKHVAGYEPLLIAVGKETGGRATLSEAVRQYSRDGDVDSLTISHAAPGKHITQIVRLYAALLDDHDGKEGDEDFILTTDADMWPLSRQWIQPIDETQIHIWGSNLYAHEAEKKYPICYIGMQREKWRRVMGLDPRKPVLEFIEHEWKMAGMDTADSMSQWCFDERLFAGKLHSFQGGRLDGIVWLERKGSRHGFVESRVDRGRWVPPKPRERLKDSHLVRPGYTEENWPKLQQLMQWLEDEGHAPKPEWADEYRAKFLEALGQEGGG